jgi:ribosome-binding factor A
VKPLRKKRLESAIVREFSNLIIKRRAKDERLGLVSVTGVDLAADLSAAVIRVSLFGDAAQNRETWQGLAANLRFFQAEIGRALRLRQTPRMRYELDTSIAEGDHIIEMIHEENSQSEAARVQDAQSDPATGG